MWIHKLQDCLSPALLRVRLDAVDTRLLCNYPVVSLTIWLWEPAGTTGRSKEKCSCCAGTSTHNHHSLLVLSGGAAWIQTMPVHQPAPPSTWTTPGGAVAMDGVAEQPPATLAAG